MAKLKELTPKPRTRVAIIIDKSGSMTSLSKFVVDTHNEQLAKLRESAADQNITITRVFFDSNVEINCFNTPLEEVKDLTYEEYRTGSMTALNDAIGTTVDKFRSLKDFEAEDLAHLVVIITDGIENDSKEYKQKNIAQMVDNLQNCGWTFTYLGANVDVKKVATDYNFSIGNTMSFDATASGVRGSSMMTSKGLNSYMLSRSKNIRSVNSFYDEPEKVDEDVLTGDVDDGKMLLDIHMGNKSLWDQSLEANEKLKEEK